MPVYHFVYAVYVFMRLEAVCSLATIIFANGAMTLFGMVALIGGRRR